MGALEIAALAALAAIPDLTRHIPLYLGVIGVAYVAYAVALWRTRFGATLDARGVPLMLVVAVLLRLAWILAPPSLSDDLYRYVWDGRVLLSGINPFRYAPEAVELSGLADGAHALINHAQVPTIYPPVAQLVFALVAFVQPSVLGIKCAMALVDVALILLLGQWLGALGKSPGRAIVYAWSPLAIIEFAGMGHVDALALFFTIAAFLALARGRSLWALLALGGAILAKLLPLVLVPFVLRRVPRRQWWLLPAVVALGYLPFVWDGVDPTVGLRTFATYWRGNDFIFALIASPLGDAGLAKLVAACTVAIVVAVLLRRRTEDAVASTRTLGTVLLTGPVIHAWYVTWLVPFLCVAPSVPWLVLSGTIQLSYLAWTSVHHGGEYATGWLVRSLEYGPPLLLGLWLWVRGRRAATQRASTSG